jgi:hypothetical protein
MTKKHGVSRWNGRQARYSADKKVDDCRWTRDGRNLWRYAIDQVSQVGYCLRRKEKNDWHKGARIRKPA